MTYVYDGSEVMAVVGSLTTNESIYPYKEVYSGKNVTLVQIDSEQQLRDLLATNLRCRTILVLEERAYNYAGVVQDAARHLLVITSGVTLDSRAQLVDFGTDLETAHDNLSTFLTYLQLLMENSLF